MREQNLCKMREYDGKKLFTLLYYGIRVGYYEKKVLFNIYNFDIFVIYE